MAARRTTPASKKASTKPAAKKTTAKKPAPAKKTAAPRSPAKRDEQVLQLHADGQTLAAIAKKLRFRDVGTAHAAYERALAKTLPDPPETTKRAELARIASMQEKLWPKADRGDLGAIAKLVQLDLERSSINRDQLLITDDDQVGPIEAATAIEVKRLSEAAPALAATALVLARTVDETPDPGPRATVARELRMHMSQLRGLAGTNPKFQRPPEPDKDEGAGKKKGGGPVVPETRLEQLRRQAAERAREGGASTA